MKVLGAPVFWATCAPTAFLKKLSVFVGWVFLESEMQDWGGT